MTPCYSDDWLTIREGDCRTVMAEMEPESVQCVVTSPPYFGLRDYGIAPSVWGGEAHEHEWQNHERSGVQGQTNPTATGTLTGGREKYAPTPFIAKSGTCPCGAWLGVLGLEPTVEMYVAHMVEVFRGVRRVLRKDGTVWLNLGDSYSSGNSGQQTVGMNERILGTRGVKQGRGDQGRPAAAGVKPKDRMMVPARVAIALQADGWWLRDEIVWHKPNPMPSSVTDRTTPAHEMVYLLTKSARYFYDAEAIKEDGAGRVDLGRMKRPEARLGEGGKWANDCGFKPGFTRRDTFARDGAVAGHVLPGQTAAQHRSDRTDTTPVVNRNKRSVWTIATAPYPDAHFATFPPKLIEPMILAGTSERGCCPECGAPWARETVPGRVIATGGSDNGRVASSGHGEDNGNRQRTKLAMVAREHETVAWQPTCDCVESGHGDDPTVPGPPLQHVPCVVLDPFAGSGTVMKVAQHLSRRAIGIDLNPEYLEQALRRGAQSPLGLEA